MSASRELLVGVQLKADGSGLVGQLRVVKGEISATGAQATAAGAQIDAAMTGAATATRTYTSAQTQAAAATSETAREQQQAAAAVVGMTRAQRTHTQAANDDYRSVGQRKAGYFQLSQNMQDVGVQMSMGTDIMRIAAMQGTQLATAIDMIGPKGAGGRVAAFFAGPWGAAILIAGSVLAPLVADLFEMDEAQKLATAGADGLSQAQSVLGQMFDLTSGKLERQNELLVLNARLAAINLRREALQEKESSRSTFDQAGNVSAGSRARGAYEAGALSSPIGMIAGAVTGSRDGRRNAGNLQNIVENVRSGKLSSVAALRLSETQDFTDVKITRSQFQQAIVDAASAESKVKIAELIDSSLDDGKLAAGLRREDRSKPKKPPKPKSTEARDEFGRDAADRIASITDRFDDTPPVVRQVQQARTQLNDLMDDLARKKPPGFEGLIAQAKEAKVAIEAGLLRPLDDFLAAQDEQLQMGRLIADGREVEAEALRAIVAIERQRGPLSAEQKQQVLDSVVALKAQERQLERIRAIQQINLNALEDMRGIITQSIYEGPQSIEALPGRLLESFKQFSAEMLTENLFGEMFRDMRDQVLGANKVDAASNQIVVAFGKAATAATNLAGAQTAAAKGEAYEAPPIEVVGQREKEDKRKSAGDIYGDGIGKVLKQVGLGEDAAEKIGKYAGKGLAGAMEGQAAAGFASLLGIKTNQTGASIGGALGAMSGIPGGAIIGGLLGGVAGNLFAPKARPGGVTVGAVDGQAGQTGTTGGDKAAIAAAGSLGDAVSRGVNQIVDRLGGELGSFSISIGKYKDDLRVNEGGRALGGVKNSGAVGFGDDADAAVAYAIQRAVAQGAVQGLSPAVAKALQSSSDIEKALDEAVKVSELETAIGGIGASLKKLFTGFDATAAERVDLARKYGLDPLAVERINGEQRAKLLDDTLRSRVGSLQDLAKNLTFGDLFEGSAADRRKALLGEIAGARQDAEAGVDGAADRLGDLVRSLITTSKDAFGTAGLEYATDRSSGLEAINRVMNIEKQRVAEAAAQQRAQTDAIKFGNKVAEESADYLRAISDNIAKMALGTGGIKIPEPEPTRLAWARAYGEESAKWKYGY